MVPDIIVFEEEDRFSFVLVNQKPEMDNNHGGEMVYTRMYVKASAEKTARKSKYG
jgi:hypothetical protein